MNAEEKVRIVKVTYVDNSYCYVVEEHYKYGYYEIFKSNHKEQCERFIEFGLSKEKREVI